MTYNKLVILNATIIFSSQRKKKGEQIFMNTNDVLQVAAYAGKIILENGGETYRVEETIKRICLSLGIKQTDSFVTPTGIMISVFDETNTVSCIKRIYIRTVNLEKVSMVNDLSRKVTNENLTLEEVKTALAYIDNFDSYSNTTILIFSGLAAAFFALLFGGTFNDFIVSFITGIVVKLIIIYLNKIKTNDFFVNAIGGAISALIAAFSMSINFGSNIDIIIIGSIMILVPGISITNAIRDTIAGDLVSGIARAVEAVFIAVAIATGTGTVLKLWSLTFGGLF
jgi:uncharacterized membrane protein YjjP (DUF1212 family)